MKIYVSHSALAVHTPASAVVISIDDERVRDANESSERHR
jgi:hypothetical protein